MADGEAGFAPAASCMGTERLEVADDQIVLATIEGTQILPETQERVLRVRQPEMRPLMAGEGDTGKVR